MTIKGLSIDNLNINKQCDEAFEIEYVDGKGKNTGVFISVVGSHSDKVRKFSIDESNRRRREAFKNSKRKNNDDFTPIEEDIDYVIRDAACRIVGWRGINDAFSPELAVTLCEINPLIRSQVVDASNDMANFTKGK